MDGREWLENVHFVIGKGFNKYRELFTLIEQKAQYRERRVIKRFLDSCRQDNRIDMGAMKIIGENIIRALEKTHESKNSVEN